MSDNLVLNQPAPECSGKCGAKLTNADAIAGTILLALWRKKIVYREDSMNFAFDSHLNDYS